MNVVEETISKWLSFGVCVVDQAIPAPGDGCVEVPSPSIGLLHNSLEASCPVGGRKLGVDLSVKHINGAGHNVPIR